ncbi:hypothetical protein M514_27476 [Trichuris suis]|uniref:Uncharacterized protein n=1 Tax=Trichuris suis TaxID=68888 RepID=A0A085MT00_9BILA|nr:hypothetical protein M514_27476 [Trichuris suis]
MRLETLTSNISKIETASAPPSVIQNVYQILFCMYDIESAYLSCLSAPKSDFDRSGFRHSGFRLRVSVPSGFHPSGFRHTPVSATCLR